MLLSEHLILESLLEEKELIFDRPELIEQAKEIFVNGDVTCHALFYERTMKDGTRSLESHKFATELLLHDEREELKKIDRKYKARIKQAELYDKHEAQRINRAEVDFFTNGIIPKVHTREDLVDRLYPYCLQTNNRFACIYITEDLKDRVVVILDRASKAIYTVFRADEGWFTSRIIAHRSNELLNLYVYNTLDVKPVDTYAAIKTFNTPSMTSSVRDIMFRKFFISQGIAPQVKQQAIRKFEEELRNRQV